MKKLHFDYSMKIEYSIPVSRCNFTIKCFPKSNARQTVRSMDISISPPTDFSFGVDGFRNKQIYGLNKEPHKEFQFKISGDVYAGEAEYEEVENDNLTMIFRHPYGLNVPGDNIRKFLSKMGDIDGNDNLEKAIAVMHCLHSEFVYQSGVTTIKTTAEEAMTLGQGVCQDYAHIFIALMHLMNIPARYVTGLIIGEGASHAWVEILMDGKWYGLDPTNDERVIDKHIKIVVGRDANDCTINRGIMHGGGLHTQKIYVNVVETADYDGNL